MKKVIAWLLVLALTAAVSIGATLAYLTDTDEDVNVMTLGKVKIDQLEYERIDVESKDDDAEVQEFHDNKPLLPAVTDKDFNYTPGTSYVDWEQIGKDGYTSDIWDPAKINNEVDKMVFVKNKGDYDAYVRSVFAFEAGKYTTLDEFMSKVHLNINTDEWTWEWIESPVTIGESRYFVATATYNNILAPGALTEISLSQIALDKTATNEDVEAFGETYQVLVKSQGIQADGFDDPAFALDEGFGVIDANNIPWDSDVATKGIDLKQALHYYEGGTTQITSKVSNVVFGLNENHEAVTANYTGTLVDVGQDVPVYAYYVPNGSNYDVYVLANDTIYTPKNSNDLMRSMSALKTVDTSNLDVSRTESMSAMLRDCTSLTSIDVSDWDTGNVTNMSHLFRNCNALASVDTSKWDTHNVTSMLATFQDCKAMTEIYVADWDTSSVTDMTQMFNRCTSLSSIDVSGWDTGKVTMMYLMFAACKELTSLDLSDWDVSNVENFGHMFTNYTGGSYYDMKLSSLDVSGWDTGSATSMQCMFYGLKKVTKLDVSQWDVSNVVSMSHMFADCNSLEALEFDNWNTPNLVSIDGIFNECYALEVLDVSTFDTQNIKELSQVFEMCTGLTEIIGLDKWDTSSGIQFDEMFNGAKSLKVLDLSSFNTQNAAPGYKDETGDYSEGFRSMFNNMNSLEKLIIGENISFDGNGNVEEAYQFKPPAPAAKEGFTAKWKNVDTGVLYLASEIPEGTAATYVPYYEYTPSGATMKNALHYLNGDVSSEKITTKVKTVTFGLTENYKTIADNNKGVLADVEQDGPVYAYYVENGSNYDVYLLASDTIYLPKDSSEMFLQMSALQKVDTSNMDTSRAENMYGFAQQCSNLVEIDTSHWDTSNVTDMGRLFQQCTILPYLDVSKWDTSNVTNMYGVFGGSEVLNNLDVSNWDTSKVTNMECTFWHCYGLEYVDVADWDVSNVTNFRGMFSGTHNQGNMKVVPEVENWDVSSAESIQDMFYGCAQIKNLDLSKWDVSNITNMRHTFADCFSLETVNVSTWDTSKVENFDGTFNDCTSLDNLDLSNWDTGSATTFAQMFEGCASLKTIKGIENWDVSNVTTAEEMFNSNSRTMTIEELDLSGWNTVKLKATWNMFYGCDLLKSVYVGDGWDMSNVTSSSNMFAGCTSLEGGNGTKFADLRVTDKTYACVDTEETPGYLTYKAVEENASS